MTRIAIVHKDKCNPNKCGDLCIKLCPINRTGAQCIIKSDENKAVIDEALCTGCGICSNRCPTEAISIINLPEALDKDPIHQYGTNGFRLYSLPVPIFGKVVGIVGRNGIGKSTAINILSGIINPNLGKTEPASYDNIIDYFKGSEAHSFFEKVKNKEIVVSLKPQQVDLIAKTQKGRVSELLKKVDKDGRLEEISEKLELNNILNNNIETLSGGELQRVAIAACVLKKADVYIFDEPTSYLDIKQRVKISKFIRDLIDETTAVMVVEHDLIILDYMTDLVHMMYGKPSCFGIVSQPKSTKSGINIYLSGYLKEENVRFRDHEIKFEAKAPVEEESGSELTRWSNIQKKLGRFTLKAEEGTINKRSVIGIIGENGIGKTSFVKILAGIETPDSGKINNNISVSYKPQYLKSDSEEIVMSVLKDAIEKYYSQLIMPLDIKPLMLKKLCELSGGELQRVSIALCLSKKADLYLLDEPSAYLDVEQRLAVSKIIKDFIANEDKTAMVVDHDLLFIDYISSELVVFKGTPALHGEVRGPLSMEDGMNLFLSNLNITLRRDHESLRPRVNKENSVKDRKQKGSGKFYYQ